MQNEERKKKKKKTHEGDKGDEALNLISNMFGKFPLVVSFCFC